MSRARKVLDPQADKHSTGSPRVQILATMVCPPSKRFSKKPLNEIPINLGILNYLSFV